MFKFCLHLFILSPIFICAQSYTGKIVQVIEGDELLFKTNDSTFTVHLYGVDAPEKGQFFSNQSIDYLERYLWTEAKIQLKKNFNTRSLSVILFINENNINKDLIKNGYAFYDRPHCVNDEFARAEEHARDKKLGLWRSRSIVSPWKFKEGVLPKPPPTDGKVNVLICPDSESNRFHKKYCHDLQLCHGNVIVILRKQARDIRMKPCKRCY